MGPANEGFLAAENLHKFCRLSVSQDQITALGEAKLGCARTQSRESVYPRDFAGRLHLAKWDCGVSCDQSRPRTSTWTKEIMVESPFCSIATTR